MARTKVTPRVGHPQYRLKLIPRMHKGGLPPSTDDPDSSDESIVLDNFDGSVGSSRTQSAEEVSSEYFSEDNKELADIRGGEGKDDGVPFENDEEGDPKEDIISSVGSDDARGPNTHIKIPIAEVQAPKVDAQAKDENEVEGPTYGIEHPSQCRTIVSSVDTNGVRVSIDGSKRRYS